jgi:hypothetical protein
LGTVTVVSTGSSCWHASASADPIVAAHALRF